MKQSRPSLAVLNEDYPKLRDLKSAHDTDGLINYLLTILNIKVSSKEEADDLKIQMLVVSDFLKTKFGYLTIPEIKEAFKMFVAREFPKIKVFRILDCVSIGEVLNAYVDFRNESLRNYDFKKQLLLQNHKETSEDEKKIIREEFLKIVFEDLRANEFSNDAWQLYFDLEKLGKLKISNLEKKILYKQEEEKYFKNQKNEISTKTAGTRRIVEINNLNEKMKVGKPIIQIQNNCRSIIASNYLKRHIEDFETFKNAISNE